MALTQAQRDAIYADIILGNLDDYASNPDSLIEVMSSEEFKQGLTCGQLSLEKLNYLFAFTMLSIQKALAESKAYAEGLTTALANALNFCNALSTRSGNLLQVDTQPDGSCKFYYGIEPPADLVNQYVDPSTGDDNNSGTRASPLRTVARAVNRIKAGTYGNIYLKEDQVHLISSQSAWNYANILIFSYGPGCDSLIAAGAMASCNWDFYGAKIAPKATIQFKYTTTDVTGLLTGRCIGVGSGYSISFFGINFITTTQSGLYVGSGWEAGVGSNLGGNAGGQSYSFRDCTMVINNGYIVGFMPNTSIVIDRTEMNKVGSGYFMKDQGNGQVEVSSYPAGSSCGTYLWMNGIDAANFKSSMMDGFVTAAPTYKNITSKSL